MKQKLIITIRALSIKRASINLVMAKCLFARGAYVGVLSSWSLNECEEIDTVFAAEIRRRTKNLKTSQSENLFQPLREGGLGYQRFSSMVQQRKRNCMRRIFSGGDQWTRLAIEGLCARGHRKALTIPLSLRSHHNVSARVSGSLAFCPTVRREIPARPNRFAPHPARPHPSSPILLLMASDPIPNGPKLRAPTYGTGT